MNADIILMKKTAEDIGFTQVEIINTSDLVFRPEYRKYCEENACGNYGVNYACPPYSGSPGEMARRVMKYSRAAVFQSENHVADAFDGAEMKALKKKHISMTLQAIDAFTGNGLSLGGLPIMCGPCNFCAQCQMPQGKPCLHPDRCFSCLSAYCIDVMELAKSCGMKISWDKHLVYFFSLFCF